MVSGVAPFVEGRLVGARRLLDELSGGERLVYLHEEPARAARYGTLVTPLSNRVRDAMGVDRLWTHQAEAIDHIRGGQSVVVATGTASGKSLCYQVPIAEAVTRPISARELSATSIMIFPTKALAQDQLRAISSFGLSEMVAATYDGDTTPEARPFIRRSANVLLTNPEMLHSGILPAHARWSSFLSRLEIVVIDELHVLRGIFGSHVGHLLRRLRRLANHYGADPTFVFSSATIGEPARLARDLCGRDVVAVSDDGSPRGPRTFALWNPLLLDPETGTRASTNAEVAQLVAALVEENWRTVGFCRSRRGTEVVTADVRRRLTPELASKVRSYRAGYLAAERREIENELFGGSLRAVMATSALELGIDVGGLDACVMNGFPGTLASMWQQAGRAGRRDDEALAVLVAGTDQLDQWYMSHPADVFTRPIEPAVVNLSNPAIMHPQLMCAAFEMPLRPTDDAYWGDELGDAVRDLVVNDGLRVRDGAAYWQGRGQPANGIGLRSGSSHEYRIVERSEGRLIGTVDSSRAFDQVHPGAIYLHLGQQYRVLSLDTHDREASVEMVDVDEFTQVRSTMDVHVIAEEKRVDIGRARLSLGRIEVVTQIVGYERRHTRTHKVIGREELELPPSTLDTRAFWYTMDDDLFDAARIGADAVPGALHAAEHAGISILPLFTICDRWDVGGVSMPFQADTGRPSIFIYDGYPGGIGIADLGFANGRRHLEATRAVIERCRCTHGCPSCVQSPKCGNGNEPLDKGSALALLRTILAS
jgi:DEAD/DEAH box helicase domain-containing protein